MASEIVRELVSAGIHFGHRVSRWNPKMKPFIFGKRNTIHIIDIRETVKGLLRAKRFIAQVVGGGKDILFVGTKRQARPHIVEQAMRVGMPYVAERWLGGTLTNFGTIRSRLTRMDELEKAVADGTALEYSKKMISSRARELRKITRNLQGIRNMSKMPGAVVVVDVHREMNAVREAKKLGIPTICLIDTDSDPDFADLPIPGNDDAMRGIGMILGHLADAVEEGLRGRTALKETTDGESEPKKRSRRPVLGRADSEPEPAATSEAPRGEGATPNSTGGEGSDAPSPADKPDLTPASAPNTKTMS